MIIPTARLLAALHDDDASVAPVRAPGTAAVLPIWAGPDPRNDAIVTRVALANLFTSRPLVKFLTVTGDSAAWTRDVHDTIARWLPRQVQVYTREVANERYSARVATRFSRGGPFSTSSLTIPLDEIDAEVAIYARRLPHLAEIVLRVPGTHDTAHAVAVSAAIDFLESFSSLVVAIVTISSARDVYGILDALQRNHSGLTRLAVLTAPGCDVLRAAGPARIRLEDTVIRALEGFTQLEHLVLDDGLMCALLYEALGRLPRLKHLDRLAGPFPDDSEAKVSRVLRSTLLKEASGFPNKQSPI